MELNLCFKTKLIFKTQLLDFTLNYFQNCPNWSPNIIPKLYIKKGLLTLYPKKSLSLKLPSG